MKKRIVSALLALCLLASLGTLPAAAAGANTARTFSDVTDLDTAAEIESLQLLGVLDGFSDGSFRPAATLTRAQFCKMAVYAMGCGKELGKYSIVTVFPDVKPSHWAASYINLASKGKAIILGYADGYFRPDSKVTYAQAVTILMRQLGYTDADVGGLWPAGYLAEAESIGLTRNLGLTASAALTRGDAAKLFANLLRCGTKDGGAFAATLGETVNNVILVSSNATALDGTAGAMETSDGSVYKMAGKSGSGLLNGRKGTLILDKSGRVMTFLAAATGASRAVTLASASSTQIVDSKGVKYTVTAATETNYNGKAATWGEVYSWLAAGEALTLYLDESGRVTYVLVGGGVGTTLAQLGSNVPGSRVSYVHTNWAGQADLIVLDTGLSGTVFYGKATVKVVPERFGDLTVDTRMLNVEYAKNGVKAESGSFECPYAVSNGDFVKAVLRGETFTSVTVLSKVAKVSNSAWIGRTAVVADGVTYTVPADVACYNRDSQSWTTLDAARAYASQATLYVEGGTVRIVEVGG